MNEVTVTELKTMMDEGADFLLIDVREMYEREVASIGGELIPLGDILNEINRIPTNRQVIIYCRSGARSAAAIHQLQIQSGFTNLYNLKGGILAWSREIDPGMAVY